MQRYVGVAAAMVGLMVVNACGESSSEREPSGIESAGAGGVGTAGRADSAGAGGAGEGAAGAGVTSGGSGGGAEASGGTTGGADATGGATGGSVENSGGSGGVTQPTGGSGGVTQPTGGSGGVTGGTGGTTAGAGGATGGAGGTTAGTGGNPGGSAGAGGVSCPMVPACNWCGGDAVEDANGCILGWVCANGADPCETEPCATGEDCGLDEDCGSDELCWPTGSEACGDLGAACGGEGDCGGGLVCPVSVCVPADVCGGFAGVVCEGEAQDCWYHDGTDVGACLTPAEQVCICATAEGQAVFPDCAR
jgi:hypothetical protein